jgi:acyl carrier protein
MKYFEEIKTILEVDDIDELDGADSLISFGFDSLAIINLISLINDRSNTDIDPDEIENLETVADLNDFIATKLSN